jgi:hypothetical protein
MLPLGYRTAPCDDPLEGKHCVWAELRSDGSPNSSYKEYICYAHVSLCQRELRKHMS